MEAKKTMKYKYAGTVPIIVYEKDEAIEIMPGQEVELQNRPSHKFEEIKQGNKKNNKESMEDN